MPSWHLPMISSQALVAWDILLPYDSLCLKISWNLLTPEQTLTAQSDVCFLKLFSFISLPPRFCNFEFSKRKPPHKYTWKHDVWVNEWGKRGSWEDFRPARAPSNDRMYKYPQKYDCAALLCAFGPSWLHSWSSCRNQIWLSESYLALSFRELRSQRQLANYNVPLRHNLIWNCPQIFTQIGILSVGSQVVKAFAP